MEIDYELLFLVSVNAVSWFGFSDKENESAWVFQSNADKLIPHLIWLKNNNYISISESDPIVHLTNKGRKTLESNNGN